MNLRSVDLNLLVVLDALLAERHVTRAAERVGLSQPAMSAALGRLRVLFGDPLLVRTPAGMEATPRALELAAETRAILRRVERVLESDKAFEPAQSSRGFALRLSDALGLLLLPALAARLDREAPGVTLAFVHLPPTRTLEALEADELDLAVSMGLDHGASVRAEPVLRDRMVCVMRAGHPAAAEELTLESFLALRHLKVAMSPTDRRFVDNLLARLRHSRPVTLTVPHWLVVPAVLRASDLVTVMPERLALAFAAGGAALALQPLPFASEPFDWSLYWHRRHEGDRAHRWLRQAVGRALTEGAAASAPPTREFPDRTRSGNAPNY